MVFRSTIKITSSKTWMISFLHLKPEKKKKEIAEIEQVSWDFHKFHGNCHSVTFYFMEKDSKWCCDNTVPESIHTKDESKHGLRLLSSLVWIDQYNQCNGKKSFMEFMLCWHLSYTKMPNIWKLLVNIMIQKYVLQTTRVGSNLILIMIKWLD